MLIAALAALTMTGLVATAVWARSPRDGPRHKDDAFSYDSVISPDGRLEARVYMYVSFFTERQELTLRDLGPGGGDREVSLGCDYAEDGAQVTQVVFSSADTLTLERAGSPSTVITFDPVTLRAVRKLGPC